LTEAPIANDRPQMLARSPRTHEPVPSRDRLHANAHTRADEI
jgi:hypothetical protein